MLAISLGISLTAMVLCLSGTLWKWADALRDEYGLWVGAMAFIVPIVAVLGGLVGVLL